MHRTRGCRVCWRRSTTLRQPGAAIVPANRLHLTLHFLGERPAGGTVDCAVRSPQGGVIVVLKAEDVLGRVTIVGNKPLK